MRKYLFLLLVLVLLLCGCTEQKPEQTDPTPPPETQPIELYVEGSNVEEQTQGVVREYDIADCLWIKNANDGLLVATNTGIHLMQGNAGTVVASLQLDATKIGNLQVLESGFAYYDKENHSVQFLDENLNKLDNEILTEDMTTPVVSPDGSMIYYCQGEEIRAFETERKISRLLKSHSCVTQKLAGIYFDGKILACEVSLTVGSEKMIYISTENGKTVFDGTDVLQMRTYQQRYLMERMDGIVHQWVTGERDGSVNLLVAEDQKLYSALECDGIVGSSLQDDGVLLKFYNVTTGLKTASIYLESYKNPEVVTADGKLNVIWLQMEDGQVLRWEIKEEETQAETVFTQLYTAESPDKAGLKTLDKRVSELNSKYGVRIRIWEEAVKVTEGYNLETEYQVTAIEQMLDELEAVFKEFPKRFVQRSISSRVRICIVRSVNDEVAGTQFWSDKYAFVVLSAGVDVRSEFLKHFAFVVDSHVLGNSPVYDYWNTLNPEGFLYGSAVNGALASGENRAFVDVDSMSSAMVDRSRIFWQAMQPNNTEMFKSEIMQSKLKMLCEGIRDAWSLEKETAIYPWEQYLVEPIAPKK